MADFNPKKIAAWKKQVKGAKDDLADIADLTAVLEQSTVKLTKSQIKNNQELSKIVDATKEELLEPSTLKDINEESQEC